MTTANRPQIGVINCAFCGAKASVHQSKIGRGGLAASLYYRCGTTANGCGCIQPRGPTGQAWIKANMSPLESEKSAPAPAPKTEQLAEPDAPAANQPGEYVPGETEEESEEKPRRRGWLDALVNGDD